MLNLKDLVLIASTYLSLLGEDRKRLPLLWISVLVASVLDVVGVGLIVPFLAVVTRPESLHETSWIKPFTTTIRSWPHEQVVLFLGASFLLVFLIKSYASVRLYLFTAAFAYRQDTAVRVRLLASFMFSPYEYHLENDRARILNALVQNINKFSTSLLALLRLLSESVVVFFLVVLLFVASPLVFSILILTLSIITIIFFYLTRGEAKKWGDISVESNRGMLKAIQESIEGLKEIRTLGIEKTFISKLHKSGQIAQQAALGSTRIGILPRYFLESGFVSLVVSLVIIFVATEGNILYLLPMIALLGLAGLRLLPSLNVILSSVSIIRYSFPAVQQICKDLDDTFVRQRNISPDSESTAEEFRTLTLKGVSFNYAGSEKYVIADLSLDIYRQQSIGLVGGSGAGKTTLVDLILGLLNPSNGEILVNDEPIRNNPSAWWRMVAYIPQSPFLSDDTITRNIALGIDDKHIDEEKINSAISASQLELFISQLPKGKNTIIGDRGIRLSGGQRQRIAIARALYFDRQVLIFDEATSALDSKTESEIVAAIDALHGSKTMIIIAHRMSTLAYCDRIIEIKQGQVTELQVTTHKTV